MAGAIHLGYEIGSGAPVSIPLAHLAVTGQTQSSGKTTTLEALVSRSDLRALTFITKRGESAFENAPEIPPYFRSRADWQYVSAILEATLREKLKFERSWIMRATKGAQTLYDVQRNIERDLEKARGLNESVLTTLHAYLEIVLPQISATDFAPSIRLGPGANVMDLSGFSLELQSLIIRSALEWVYAHEHDTAIVIPEAWEFIPQNRGSPVKLAAEQLIRKGGVLHNFVWLDAQDLAVMHKDILRSIQVWILGVQRERNEVTRTLAHITGAAKPKAEDVMELGLGEFFVCYGKVLRRVYVQPAWMREVDACSHAQGGPMPTRKATPQRGGIGKSRESGNPGSVQERAAKSMQLEEFAERGRRAQRTVDLIVGGVEKEEAVWKEKYEALEKEVKALRQENASLKTASRIVAGNLAETPAAVRTAGEGWWPETLDTIYAQVRQRLLSDPDPGILEVLARRPEIRVKVERPILQLDDSTLRGRLAHLVADGFFDEPAAGNAAFNELKRLGFAIARSGCRNVYREMNKLAEIGIVTVEAGGYQKAPGAIVRKAGA
jgi:hypothetical protein